MVELAQSGQHFRPRAARLTCTKRAKNSDVRPFESIEICYQRPWIAPYKYSILVDLGSMVQVAGGKGISTRHHRWQIECYDVPRR